MVVTLVITGVSYRVDLYELALHLNGLLNANEIGTCRMRALPNHRKTNRRQIGLEFDSGFEAMPAQDLLNGYDYAASDGVVYKIQAKISSSESPMAHSLHSIEAFEREIYKFSMSDLLKSPKRSPQRKHKMPVVTYRPGHERERDRRKRRSRSPESRFSVVKKRKCEPKESDKRRYKSTSPSYSKKKKQKKYKKDSKVKRKEEKKQEKLKKKKKKRRTSSVSSSKNSDDLDVELLKRKRRKKKKNTKDDHRSNLLRECKILEQQLNEIKASKSKRSDSLCCEETNILKLKSGPEAVKTDHTKVVNTESEDVYVWSDDSCDSNNETSKHGNDKNKKHNRNSNEILSRLKDSNNLERSSKTLQNQNSIGKVANSSLQDSNTKNMTHKINESEKNTFTNSTYKNTQSSDVLDIFFERLKSNKSRNDKCNIKDIITLPYDEFEKEYRSKIDKSKPTDEIEQEETYSKPQNCPNSNIVIKSEPKDDIGNEAEYSELQPTSESVVIKSEPIDKSNINKRHSQLPFIIESVVIKSERNDKVERKDANLEHEYNIKEEVTVIVDNDSESTLELEVENDIIPTCNQEVSAKLTKHKEDDLKIWDVLDEVLQDIPSDIF